MGKKIFSRCGMRCDLCLIYRPNVEKEDRRVEAKKKAILIVDTVTNIHAVFSLLSQLMRKLFKK